MIMFAAQVAGAMVTGLAAAFGVVLVWAWLERRGLLSAGLTLAP